MEFSRTRSGEGLELHLSGRLDGFSATQLQAELDRLIAGGSREIRLDLSEVSFLSSAGVGVIVRYHQQLPRQGGTLVVSVASPPVSKVLEMARLGALVVKEPARRSPPVRAAGQTPPLLEVEVLDAGARLRGRVAGDADVLRGVWPRERKAQRLVAGRALWAVGVGAFGSTFRKCCDRFGDFLAVGRAAAYMPHDGSNVPDFLAGPAEIVAAYALVCEGRFSHRLRFRSASARDLLETAEQTAGGAVGVLIAGEGQEGGVVAAETGSRLCGAFFHDCPAPPANPAAALEEMLRNGSLARVAPLSSDVVLSSGYCCFGPLVLRGGALL
jgi:anti-anti-sigma factor